MSLENIIKTIEDQAAREAGRIVRESEDKARDIRERARREAEAEARVYLEESERRARLEAGRIVSQARLDKRLKILSQKKEIIDEIIAEAFKQKGLSWKDLKKTVVMKDGEKLESLDELRLREELRPELEKDILDVLKI
ncbi:MAG: V-type ATP synthase subunit E family protein [Candidatus Aminicenantaceae bacterium]